MAQRSLPPIDVLSRLKDQGWTYAEIGAEYGVTPGAVYATFSRAGMTRKRADHTQYIPWVVATKHRLAWPLFMLRLLARKEKGETLKEDRARWLEGWLAGMAANNLVVCYSPKMAPNPASPNVGGFYYSRRRPSDQDSIIRVNDGDILR